MPSWKVSNIKCQSCAKSIRKQLSLLPTVSQVEVDIDQGVVAFEAQGDQLEKIEQVLKRMGYVRDTDPDGNGVLSVAKSFVSCLAGRLDS